MATTTTTQTKAASSLPQKAVLGFLSSLPTTNPTVQAIQKTLPLLPPSILPNLPNLGNGQSSAMAATLAAGTGTQNPTNNTNQNNTCEVWAQSAMLLSSAPHLPFVELSPASQMARPRIWSITQLLFESLCEGQLC